MLKLKNPSLFRQQAYIGGKWVDSSQAFHTILNPATNQPIGKVPIFGAKEAKEAIDAAEKAGRLWALKTAKERSAVLRAWCDEILKNKDDLALILTSEQGKPLAEAAGEIVYGASFIEWFSEEAKRVYGDLIPATQVGRRIIVAKQPVGVCAGITPWNFPSSMITRKVGPALAAGCSMVLKPAKQTPFSALALAALGEVAGIPPGLFSVITGEASSIGAELCRNPTVRKLSFTGSTATGAKLMEQCAPTIKKLSLELGGNAPFIVFDDADIDAAVQGALDSKFRNSGQTCVCTNRVLVQRGVYKAFTDKFAAAVQKLKLGAGTEAGVTQGPLINVEAIEHVTALVKDAVHQGAKVVCGGKVSSLGGTFFEPTVVSDVTPKMRITKEEIFGPVASIMPFDTEEEAIALANATEYGLASYFYTQNSGRVWRVSEGLEYGMVGVNTGLMSTEVAPFGGVKSSGLGREGSKYGIEEYLELKYICVADISR